MDNKIYASTGAFIGRVNGRNYKLVLEYGSQIHCDGFELMMYDNWYGIMDQIIRDMSDSSLKFPVTHTEKSIGERISRNEQGDTEYALERFRKNCYIAQGLGSDKLVTHLWGGSPSDKNIGHNIELFSKLDEIARSYHLLLTIENVVCNTHDPMTHIKELHHLYPNIMFTFDTKMAAFHQQLNWIYENEWNWLWKENKIAHLHVNDYSGGYMDWSNLKTLHIGEGKIEFETFFDYIEKKEYQGSITVESTSMSADGSVQINKLNKSLDYIYNRIR